MSRIKSPITNILKKQEEERKDLAAGAYMAWLPIKEREVELLAGFEGQYEKAFPEIQKGIDEAREAYYEEYGADGKLAALMSERHAKERNRLAIKMEIIDDLNESQERNKGKGYGR